MSFPAELDDPTLTADGTKCGENMVNLLYYIHQSGVSLPSLKSAWDPIHPTDFWDKREIREI